MHAKHMIPASVLPTIVNALVMSHVRYCSQVFGCANKTALNRLQKVQNFAARLISGRRKREHVSDAIQGLEWLPVAAMVNFNDLCLLHTKSLWLVSPMYWDERCATTEMSLNAKPGSRIICICLVSAPTLAKERLDIGRARCTMNTLSGLACRERHMRILRKWWRLVLLARMFYSFV